MPSRPAKAPAAQLVHDPAAFPVTAYLPCWHAVQVRRRRNFWWWLPPPEASVKASASTVEPWTHDLHCAPLRPEIVTTSLAAKLAVNSSETVMTLSIAPAAGLLCPIAK